MKPPPPKEHEHLLKMEVSCPIDTRVLGMLRRLATMLAEEVGFSDEEVGQIEMAVDEACTNVVRHAYKHLGVSPDLPAGKMKVAESGPASNQKECMLTVRIEAGDDLLRFVIIDNGIGANRTPGGVKDIEEYLARGARGGLGTMIITNFMDEVDYSYPEGAGTVLTMTKYARAGKSA